jgi:hypothetical protein
MRSEEADGMQPRSPEEVLSELLRAVESRYYSDEAGGQMWLHDLSVYLQALPSSDERLQRLVGTDVHEGVTEHLRTASHPIVSQFDASAWLDDLVERSRRP